MIKIFNYFLVWIGNSRGVWCFDLGEDLEWGGFGEVGE